MLSPCIWYDDCRRSPSAHSAAHCYERHFEVIIPARTRATPTAIVAATLPAPDDFLCPINGCIVRLSCPLEIFFSNIFFVWDSILVYGRRVEPSAVAFSLSSHRQFIYVCCIALALSLHNKQKEKTFLFTWR